MFKNNFASTRDRRTSQEIGWHISHPACADDEGGEDSKPHQMIKGPPLGIAGGGIDGKAGTLGHLGKSGFQSHSPRPCIM